MTRADRWRLIPKAAWRGVVELYDSDGLTHAASIAYYALLSLFPFSMVAVAILGSATADPADRNTVLDFVLRYFPEQFDFITDLTIRGKEALRAMGIRFAQAPYAETKRS